MNSSRITTTCLALVALLLAGCGSPQVASYPSGVSAGVRPEQDGLEVRWWVVRGSPESIGSTFAPYVAEAVAMDPDVRLLWAAHGLRVVAIPLDDLDGLQTRVRMAASEQHHWLGQMPGWTEIARGPNRDAGQVIAMETERLSLPGGALRLIARAWTTPVAGTDGPTPELQVEVLPQHHEDYPDRDPELLLGVRARPREAERQGLLFTRFMARMSCRSDYAYAIIPERAGVVWSEDAASTTAPAQAKEPTSVNAGLSVGQVRRGSGDVEADGSEVAPESGEDVPVVDDEFAGPPIPTIPTLGEAMLLARRPNRPSEDIRAVILLIPHLPDRYSLLN